MDECIHCQDQVFADESGALIDNSGGDVCGAQGGNEPHELVDDDLHNPTAEDLGPLIVLHSQGLL